MSPRMASLEDIKGHLFLAFFGRAAREALRLEREHGPVPAAKRHQLIVAAFLDDVAVLYDCNPVSMPYRREPMRNKDRRAGSRCRQDPLEDLRLAPDVELSGRLIEQ